MSVSWFLVHMRTGTSLRPTLFDTPDFGYLHPGSEFCSHSLQHTSTSPNSVHYHFDSDVLCSHWLYCILFHSQDSCSFYNTSLPSALTLLCFVLIYSYATAFFFYYFFIFTSSLLVISFFTSTSLFSSFYFVVFFMRAGFISIFYFVHLITYIGVILYRLTWESFMCDHNFYIVSILHNSAIHFTRAGSGS